MTPEEMRKICAEKYGDLPERSAKATGLLRDAIRMALIDYYQAVGEIRKSGAPGPLCGQMMLFAAPLIRAMLVIQSAAKVSNEEEADAIIKNVLLFAADVEKAFKQHGFQEWCDKQGIRFNEDKEPGTESQSFGA